MKKAVILHGTDGNPEANWLPWVKNQLVEYGYDVWIPLLPENHTPNICIYDKFLKESGWDFTNNLLVGHSSGATAVLNLLQCEWLPKVDTVILVGTFLNEKLLEGVSWYEPGQFDNLFSEKLDIELIKNKANNFYFIHGDDDTYCDTNDARKLSEEVSGKFIAVPEGKHLSSNRTELPEILPILEEISS